MTNTSNDLMRVTSPNFWTAPPCPEFARVRFVSDDGVTEFDKWGTVRDEWPTDDEGHTHSDLRWVEWDDEIGMDLVPLDNLTEA